MICVFRTLDFAAIVKQVSPLATTYHFLHFGVDPRTVGAGGKGYEVPSMIVVVGGGPVVVVDVGGVDMGLVVVLVGRAVVVGRATVVAGGSPAASTQYDSPDSIKLSHCGVIEGF